MTGSDQFGAVYSSPVLIFLCKIESGPTIPVSYSHQFGQNRSGLADSTGPTIFLDTFSSYNSNRIFYNESTWPRLY